jgi:hypothetical protein
MMDKKDAHSVCVRKNVEKKPFGRPANSWESNIKMFIHEEGYGCEMDWSDSR